MILLFVHVGFGFFVLAFCLDASAPGNVSDLDNTIHTYIYIYRCTYNSYRHNFLFVINSWEA